ncbi:hypothetical protein ACIQ4I_13870 [Rummeliibacillus sp. NPDC094406]|uniref:hypothetical protein n=1 Tax=Rummeliibacillus sp. NPDC094406 TaxID=3364511 RepID=UPI00380AC549
MNGGKMKMKIEELQHTNVLARPEANKRTIPDGAYNGETTKAEFLERDSQYSEDGKRVVLNIKIEVEDDAEEVIDLYIAPNYSWSKQGNMMKILEKLDVLPAPGESIDLDELVGIPVQVIVENVEKDGETYSNIVSIKRIKANQPQRTIKKKPIAKKTVAPKRRVIKKRLFGEQSTSTDEFDIPFDLDESIETDDDFDNVDNTYEQYEDED